MAIDTTKKIKQVTYNGTEIPLRGYDTSDATVTAGDMPSGIIGYGKTGKVTGTVPAMKQVILTEGSATQSNVSGYSGVMVIGKYNLPSDRNKQIVTDELGVLAVAPYSEFGDVGSSDVAEGKTFTSTGGLKITGDLPVVGDGATIALGLGGGGGTVGKRNGTYMYVSATNNTKRMLAVGAAVSCHAKFAEFGDATAADVAKGKTFTSAAGLKVTGTAAGSSAADVTFDLYNNGFANLAVVYMSKTDGVMNTTIPNSDHVSITTSEGSMVVLINQDLNGYSINLIPDNGVSIAQGWRTANVTMFVAGAETNGMNIDVEIM